MQYRNCKCIVMHSVSADDGDESYCVPGYFCCVFRHCPRQQRTSFCSWYTATYQHHQLMSSLMMMVADVRRCMTPVLLKMLSDQMLMEMWAHMLSCRIMADGLLIMVSCWACVSNLLLLLLLLLRLVSSS